MAIQRRREGTAGWEVLERFLKVTVIAAPEAVRFEPEKFDRRELIVATGPGDIMINIESNNIMIIDIGYHIVFRHLATGRESDLCGCQDTPSAHLHLVAR